MAITTKFLEDLGISKEIAAQIFAERGKEVAETNTAKADLEQELATAKKNLETLTAEAETLRIANADGNEWKIKFEKLQNDIAEEKKQAEADRIAKEKQTDIENRFNSVLGDKKFSHEAIRESYLRKFGEAIEDEEYKGKGDSAIFHALTKDDKNAFKGIEVVKLAGGTPTSNGKYTSREDILNIKDTATRQKEMWQNPQFFPELSK